MGRVNCSDEHIYDSADQTSKNRTKSQVIPSVPNERANKKEHVYRAIEAQESSQEGEVDSKSHTLAANVLEKTIQYESAEFSPIQFNQCQFDDLMYEGTIQPRANSQVTTTSSSIKADLIMDTDMTELQGKGNLELIQNYDGDIENFTDAPKHSDPTDSESMGAATVQDVLDKRDKGNANLSNIYDIFDDPTYGVSRAGSNREIIH